MHAERDELVKFVFPELRRRCRERAVEFVEVDLRWGITDEQKSEGKVLPICLAEIDRCRPYFIGLLGERYGWVPETIDEDLARQQEWLLEHKEKSVTELEIVHGVLRNPAMRGLAFFYLRDPESSRRVEEDLARQPDYRPEPKSSREKLNSLKEKIRNSGYAVNEGFADPKTLGSRILEDLWEVIDKRFPQDTVPTPLERERMDHEAFAAVRTKVYIGRQEYFRQLDEHAAGEDPPLVLLGESGSGKSALLANWVNRYREAHPDDFLVAHYIGSSADSTDHVRLLRTVMEEIRARYPEPPGGLQERGESEILVDPQKIVEAFPLWLAKAAARGKFVLILDALNQIEDRDNAPDLGWLPGYFPPGVRVVLSTLAGRSLEALERRGWPTYSMHPLDAAERKKLIEEYLSRFGRKLSGDHAARIAAASQSSNPLYLRALLDELRLYGDHHTLGLRIGHYLAAETVDALYVRILERYEQDYERERPGLVRDAMTLLWASRRGLTESELLDLLGSGYEPLPRAFWSPLLLAVDDAFVSRSGLLNFFHDFLRKAVKERYLRDPDVRRRVHLRLADYFNLRKPDDRKAEELPWQLSKAEEWGRLKDCLTDLPIFNHLNTDATKYELVGYWRLLEGRYDMVDSYRDMIEKFEGIGPPNEELANLNEKVAYFLCLNARYIRAAPFYRRALTIREKVVGQDHRATANNLYQLAWLLGEIGDYNEAELLCRRALDAEQKILGPEHPDTAATIDWLAHLLHQKGDYVGAEPLYRRALAAKEKALGTDHPLTAKTIQYLAVLLQVKGDFVGAELLFRRALGSLEKAVGPEHPDTAVTLSQLAWLLQQNGNYVEAESLSRRALAVLEKVLGPEHPYTAKLLNQLAWFLQQNGNYDGAEPLFRRGIAVLENVVGPEHPDTAVTIKQLAWVLQQKGNYAGAELLYRRALAALEKVLGPEHPHTSVALQDLAWLLRQKGDYAEAEPLYLRALAALEKVLGAEHPETATVINNLGDLLRNRGDYERAEPLIRRALDIREKRLGPEHPYTGFSLNSLALLLCKRGKKEEAESLYQQAMAAHEKAFGAEHPETATVINNLADLLWSKGDYAGAEPLHRKALAIREKVLGPDHPDTATSVNNLALLLQAKGDYASAEPLLRRALAIYERVLGPDHPETIQRLFALAQLLRDRGDHSESAVHYQRLLTICETVGGRMGTLVLAHIQLMAISHNELAFHSDIPAKNWEDAGAHYRQAVELFGQIGAVVEAANVELNLLTMFWLLGLEDGKTWAKVDEARVKELTRILEEAGDRRAEKGRKLLDEMKRGRK